jgi:hypothetical protein
LDAGTDVILRTASSRGSFSSRGRDHLAVNVTVFLAASVGQIPNLDNSVAIDSTPPGAQGASLPSQTRPFLKTTSYCDAVLHELTKTNAANAADSGLSWRNRRLVTFGMVFSKHRSAVPSSLAKVARSSRS